MKKTLSYLFSLAMLNCAYAQQQTSTNASMNKVKLEFTLDQAGSPSMQYPTIINQRLTLRGWVLN